MIIFWSFPGWARVVQTVKNINDSTDNMVKISETADKTLTYVTKVTGVSTGGATPLVDQHCPDDLAQQLFVTESSCYS